ncbi:MAG: hypothetical protein WCA44_05885 [Acidobacteriaceae bacterium]
MKPDEVTQETAICRGCGMKLDGKPYRLGGSAYHPRTGKRCPANHYGGHVCSPTCDFNSSLRLEQTMPGHGPEQRTLSCYAAEALKRNWPEEV